MGFTPTTGDVPSKYPTPELASCISWSTYSISSTIHTNTATTAVAMNTMYAKYVSSPTQLPTLHTNKPLSPTLRCHCWLHRSGHSVPRAVMVEPMNTPGTPGEHEATARCALARAYVDTYLSQNLQCLDLCGMTMRHTVQSRPSEPWIIAWARTPTHRHRTCHVPCFMAWGLLHTCLYSSRSSVARESSGALARPAMKPGLENRARAQHAVDVTRQQLACGHGMVGILVRTNTHATCGRGMPRTTTRHGGSYVFPSLAIRP